MKEKIKIGYIGLGRRGYGVLKSEFSEMSDVEIKYICDVYEDRLEKCKNFLAEKGIYTIATTDYKEILADEEVDAVVIMTGWSGRPQLAMECMRAGKYTAIEVGCAETLDECFDLVRTYEETGVPVMMLENCCYGRREMLALNLIEKGLLGETVHCTGGYQHYLNHGELFPKTDDGDARHYRLAEYIKRNRENYPTHELGPISKALKINRGNRIVRLSSVSSKSVGIKAYAAERFGEDSEYAKTDYAQGDIVNTVITCAGGETILLTLDTTLPRAYYCRNFCVRGTKGMMTEERRVVFFDGMEEGIENNEAEMYEKYDHPLQAEYMAEGARGGHDGMDWLVCRAFIESVKRGTNTPIDVYDAAVWMAIGPLSEMSIKANGAPVEMPDFTNGKWMDREPVVESKYCLDRVCEDRETSIFPE